MQSPIDVSDGRVTLVRRLGYLNHSYRAAEASIVNRGHDIMVRIRWQGRAGQGRRVELIPAYSLLPACSYRPTSSMRINSINS
jgi:carbonic anhydrase